MIFYWGCWPRAVVSSYRGQTPSFFSPSDRHSISSLFSASPISIRLAKALNNNWSLVSKKEEILCERSYVQFQKSFRMLPEKNGRREDHLAQCQQEESETWLWTFEQRSASFEKKKCRNENGRRVLTQISGWRKLKPWIQPLSLTVYSTPFCLSPPPRWTS